MEYKKAVEAAKIVKEIELNETDINILERAMQNDIIKAQITIMGSDAKFSTSIYKNDRLNLLVKVLEEENYKLRKRLSEL